MQLLVYVAKFRHAAVVKSKTYLGMEQYHKNINHTIFWGSGKSDNVSVCDCPVLAPVATDYAAIQELALPSLYFTVKTDHQPVT